MKRIICLLLALAFCVSGLSALTFAEGCPHGNTVWLRLNGRGCALYCNDCLQFLSEEQPHQYGEDGLCTRCQIAAKPWRSSLPEPVMQVTADKDSYDLYNKMTVTLTLTNPEEVAGWWDAAYWRDTDEWLSGEMFRLCGSDGGQQIPGSVTVEEATDYSLTLTLSGLLIITPEEYPEMIGDVLFEADIPWKNDYDMRLYCPLTILYTGACVPCEGEHDFGDWQFAFGNYYPELGEDGGHMRICRTCGYRELKDEACTLETKRNDFTDEGGNLTGCYEEYQECAVCHYCPVSEVHHVDLHPVTGGSPAGCTQWGYEDRYYHCDACGRDSYEEYELRQLPPLGHDLQDGICSRCHLTFSQLDCVATLTLDKDQAGDGELIVATYTLKDAQNAPIAGVEVMPYCTAFPYYETGYSFNALGYGETDENGVARFYIRPYRAFNEEEGTPLGEHVISVSAEGYADSVATCSFTFTGEETPREEYTVKFTADPALINDYSETGDMVTYSCEVLDQNGDPVPCALVTFDTYYRGELDFSRFWFTRADGVCTIRFGYDQTEDVPFGTFTVTATVGDQKDTGSFVFIKAEGDITGDVDGDGKVTSTDARLTLQLSVNKIRESDLTVPAAADADHDGKVTSTDARLILQYSVGKIKDWP